MFWFKRHCCDCQAVNEALTRQGLTLRTIMTTLAELAPKIDAANAKIHDLEAKNTALEAQNAALQEAANNPVLPAELETSVANLDATLAQ